MSALFTPCTINGLTFRNRVVLPPMVCAVMPALGVAADEDDGVTDGLIEHYALRARAGTGCIIVEAAAIDRTGRCWQGGVGAYADAHVPGLARLAAAIREAGAVAAIQLVHGGPQGKLALNGENVAPSAIAPSPTAPTPRELTIPEILEIQQRFADAAARCAAAGFQVIELHGAHGFLLDSFLMKKRNHRLDAYGGSRENRQRMLVETVQRVRARLGAGTLLDCRISLFNKLDEGDLGLRLESLVQGLEQAGVDLLHLSTDGALRPAQHVGPEIGRVAGVVRETVAPTFGQLIKSLTSLPLIVAGGLGDPRDADRVIADGHADFAAVGRAMLDDPEWTLHAQQMLGE